MTIYAWKIKFIATFIWPSFWGLKANLENLLKFSSPNIREILYKLFKELDQLTKVRRSIEELKCIYYSKVFSNHSLQLNNFLIDVCKQELDDPYTIHKGICIEIEDLMMDDERISRNTFVILMDFTESEPFGLEYNYEDLTPEMVDIYFEETNNLKSSSIEFSKLINRKNIWRFRESIISVCWF